jgi:hypothetical protein
MTWTRFSARTVVADSLAPWRSASGSACGRHANEAQFLGKRGAMRALADGRNLILDVSMASAQSVALEAAASAR